MGSFDEHPACSLACRMAGKSSEWSQTAECAISELHSRADEEDGFNQVKIDDGGLHADDHLPASATAARLSG